MKKRLWLLSLAFLLPLRVFGAVSINPSDIKPGTISTTEFGYLNGVTNSIQDQLDAIGSGANITNIIWGNVYGTVSNQTDLWAYLTNRYTKAEVSALAVSTFTNDEGYLVAETDPVWATVSNLYALVSSVPTNNNQLINGAGYITGTAGTSTNLSDYNNDVPFLISYVETDPVFGNWLTTNGYVQAETDPIFTNWLTTNGYVQAETDPVFGTWLTTNGYVQAETDPVWLVDKPDYYPRTNPSNFIQISDVPAQTTQVYVAQAGTAQVAIVYAETDPVFGNWLTTNGYVQAETDPVWTAASNLYPLLNSFNEFSAASNRFLYTLHAPDLNGDNTGIISNYYGAWINEFYDSSSSYRISLQAGTMYRLTDQVLTLGCVLKDDYRKWQVEGTATGGTEIMSYEVTDNLIESYDYVSNGANAHLSSLLLTNGPLSIIGGSSYKIGTNFVENSPCFRLLDSSKSICMVNDTGLSGVQVFGSTHPTLTDQLAITAYGGLYINGEAYTDHAYADNIASKTNVGNWVVDGNLNIADNNITSIGTLTGDKWQMSNFAGRPILQGTNSDNYLIIANNDQSAKISLNGSALGSGISMFSTNEIYLEATGGFTGSGPWDFNSYPLTNIGLIAMVGPMDLNGNMVSNATYDSWTESTEITVANGTGTVTRSMGDTLYLTLTNDATLTMADEWPTNGVGRVRIDVIAGTNTLTLPTNEFTWATTPTFTNSGVSSTYFAKPYAGTLWEVRQ